MASIQSLLLILEVQISDSTAKILESNRVCAYRNYDFDNKVFISSDIEADVIIIGILVRIYRINVCLGGHPTLREY